MLRLIILLCLIFLTASRAFADKAGDLREYSSELLTLESRQVLQPDSPYRYSDVEHGANLRKLLSPARTKVVLSTYFDNTLAGGSPPEVVKQLQPMLNRYDKAFALNPKEFEEEYLDTLEVTVFVLQRSLRVPKPVSAPQSTIDPEIKEALQRLLESAEGLMSSVSKMVGSGIRDKVSKGMFSEAGAKRALDMAFRIDGVAASSATASGQLSPQTQTRPLLAGWDVYMRACAECHNTGIVGAPRLRDFQAWMPRLKVGLPALLKATLAGKGPMPVMSGGEFHDIEIERAVVFLTNNSGGKFVEPPLPAGHPGTVTVIKRATAPVAGKEVVPYAAMTPDQKLKLGERVYVVNCAACHGIHGKGFGPIPSLHYAPAYVANTSAIAVVLKGSANRAMPAWNFLSNDEIAEVINYSRATFSNGIPTPVGPEDVKNLRN
jgi:mono/diheme cytochrome c family protein